MTTLADLHEIMEKQCVDENGGPLVGVCFRTEFLMDRLDELLRGLQTQIEALSLATTFPGISAGLRLGVGDVDLGIVNDRVVLLKFNPQLVLRETGPPNDAYSTVGIAFDPVPLKLALDENDATRLRLYLDLEEVPTFSTALDDPDLQVVERNGMTDEEFRSRRDALLAQVLVLEILDEFVASIAVPDLVGAMRTFRVGQPQRYVFDNHYIIVTGPADKLPPDPCDCGPGAGLVVSERHSASPKPTVVGTDNVESNGLSGSFGREVRAVAERMGEGGMPELAVYYPKSLTFDVLAESTVGPGIGASDRARALMFRWFYNAFGRPVKIQVSIDLTNHSVAIDAPMHVGGGTGVGMKVGCVTVPLLSSQISGEIDPLHFSLRFAVAQTGSGSAIVVTCDAKADYDVAFYNPPLLDIILNIVVSSLGRKLFRDEIRRLCNELTFRVIDLDALGLQAERWRASTDLRADSVLASFVNDPG